MAAQVEARGARAIVFASDVADTAAMARVAADFVQKAGGADLVMANAGIGIPSGILQGRSEPIAQLVRINVIGVTNTPIEPRSASCAGMVRAKGRVSASPRRQLNRRRWPRPPIDDGAGP